MAGLCVSLKDGAVIAQFTDSLTPLQDKMVAFANEFGKNCGVFDAIEDFVGDFKQDATSAIKDIMDAASAAYNTIQSTINGINNLLEEGVALLVSYIDSAVSAINSIIDQAFAAIDSIRTAIGDAANALATAACSALSSAISGMPSDVKINSAAAVASELFDATDPKKFVGDALNNMGITGLKDSLTSLSSNLSSTIPSIPDLSAYICTPE